MKVIFLLRLVPVPEPVVALVPVLREARPCRFLPLQALTPAGILPVRVVGQVPESVPVLTPELAPIPVPTLG